MRFLPDTISRKVTEQGLLVRKNSPTILFGVGVASMVGSTVLACRATLRLEEVLNVVEHDMTIADAVREEHAEEYSEEDHKKDTVVIYSRGIMGMAKLYAPSIVLGGIGIVCLTKSHKILQERNVALTAAYLTVDKAFQTYRDRVVDRFGEEVDRELRYSYEEVDVIDNDTGEVTSAYRVTEDGQSGYARYFDKGNPNWSGPQYADYNSLYLRNQQNWANDMLRSRGHLFLNEVYNMLGLSHTSAGAVVGWVFTRDNEAGDNYVDFGCWDRDGRLIDFFNGVEGSILLDFNVDGPIWQQIDALKEENS